MRHLLRKAMYQPETFVIEMSYRDSKGNQTRRTVSPIRFVGRDRFLGLCLCREEPRQFYLDRCDEVRLIPAAEVIMPVAMQAVETEQAAIIAASTTPAVPATCLA